ncbi:MAG TPA: helix-hairpin-helix domain-containing protein [Polyangiaceae bacterium]|nr:helix-hairpin-helix domain-containing protein [Polyangiaceae bacterium]
MSPGFRETLSRAGARVVGSRFAKPVARVAAAAAGLLLLAFIGKTAVAGAMAASAAQAAVASAAPPAESLVVAVPLPAPASAAAPGPDPTSARAAQTHATSDDPVILNTANVDDLRRLPGIGEKRANAILALRSHLGGRFRAIEDLLKVKGIGRATLRRLRPLVRLDPAPESPPDAGTSEAPR